MKKSKIFLTAAISAGIATTIIAAVCTVNHQYPCSHQHPSGNKGSCLDGEKVLCYGQSYSICSSITNALEVMEDFPTSCENCSTTTNHQGVQIYSEHHNCNSPDQPCFRSTTCRWDYYLNSCVPNPDNQNQWNYRPKRTISDCN